MLLDQEDASRVPRILTIRDGAGTFQRTESLSGYRFFIWVPGSGRKKHDCIAIKLHL